MIVGESQGELMKHKYLWLGLICCAVLLAGLGIAFLAGVNIPQPAFLAMLLICPLGHIGMILLMRHQHSKREEVRQDVDSKPGKSCH